MLQRTHFAAISDTELALLSSSCHPGTSFTTRALPPELLYIHLRPSQTCPNLLDCALWSLDFQRSHNQEWAWARFLILKLDFIFLETLLRKIISSSRLWSLSWCPSVILRDLPPNMDQSKRNLTLRHMLHLPTHISASPYLDSCWRNQYQTELFWSYLLWQVVQIDQLEPRPFHCPSFGQRLLSFDARCLSFEFYTVHRAWVALAQRWSLRETKQLCRSIQVQTLLHMHSNLWCKSCKQWMSKCE